MCRPVVLQSWSTNEAIRGMGMSELGRGDPNYRGLKVFFRFNVTNFIFKLQ